MKRLVFTIVAAGLFSMVACSEEDSTQAVNAGPIDYLRVDSVRGDILIDWLSPNPDNPGTPFVGFRYDIHLRNNSTTSTVTGIRFGSALVYRSVGRAHLASFHVADNPGFDLDPGETHTLQLQPASGSEWTVAAPCSQRVFIKFTVTADGSERRYVTTPDDTMGCVGNM
jgi:hypothetical protein